MSTVTQMIPLNQRVMIVHAHTTCGQYADSGEPCAELTQWTTPALGIISKPDPDSHDGAEFDYLVQPPVDPHGEPGSMSLRSMSFLVDLFKGEGDTEAVVCTWPAVEDPERLAAAIERVREYAQACADDYLARERAKLEVKAAE